MISGSSAFASNPTPEEKTPTVGNGPKNEPTSIEHVEEAKGLKSLDVSKDLSSQERNEMEESKRKYNI